MTIPDRVRLPISFDADSLRADLGNLPDDAWVPHFNQAIYEGDWSGVALRSAGGTIAIYPDPTRTDEFADTEHLARCPAGTRHLGPAGQLGLDGVSHSVRVCARLDDQAADETFWLVEQCDQQMLSVDLRVTQPQRLGLGVVESFLGLLSQSIHVHVRIPARRDAASSSSMRRSRSSTRPIAA